MTPTGDWRRTHTCGELRASHVGQTATLNGWVNRRRDHGGIYFVDLRDRYGQTQVVLSQAQADAVRFSSEYVLCVRGRVVARDAANVNPERPTGAIELRADSVEILSTSPTPPFEIDDQLDTALETRLAWRYLDLRRAPMQRNMLHRSRFVHAIRCAFQDLGFAEIETPVLTRATPEGARDYLVPSRVHPGEWYALPQSPQIFKQILMVAGMDRYFQVARCFRDEDLRADRQPEFTQLDMEMSFVEEEDVFGVWETVLARVFREVLGVALPLPFPRLSYRESMERYGNDKPDTRFGLELKDAASWARECEFQVFRGALAQGGRVKALVVPAAHALSRKDVEQLEVQAKELGARGLAWWKARADGGVGPLARFAAGERAEALMRALGAANDDMCLFMAGDDALVHKVLAELRLSLGRRFGLVKPGWNMLWVTEFPMFLWNAEDKRWESAHHPFTAPRDWSLGGTAPRDGSLGGTGTAGATTAAGAAPELAGLVSRAYDLVLNGWELGSGSIRIHRADVQQRVFEILGIGAEEQQQKFGFLLQALAYGAPPHGGFAVGLDRLTAMTLGLDNIRDVVAFPKTASATDLMCGAPAPVAPRQLEEVHVAPAGKALRPRA